MRLARGSRARYRRRERAEWSVAQITVRVLEDDVFERLRERAKAHRRSPEMEAREILRAAVIGGTDEATTGLGTRIASLFTGAGLDEDTARWHSRDGRSAASEE